MQLQTRSTHSFMTIKVDEIETTIFYNDSTVVDDFIANLLSICDTLASETNRDLHERLKDIGY